MTDPLKLGSARAEKLSAPNRAVRSITGSIKRNAKHGAVEPCVFEHAGHNVCVMMLHGH